MNRTQFYYYILTKNKVQKVKITRKMPTNRPPTLGISSFKKQIITQTHETDHTIPTNMKKNTIQQIPPTAQRKFQLMKRNSLETDKADQKQKNKGGKNNMKVPKLDLNNILNNNQGNKRRGKGMKEQQDNNMICDSNQIIFQMSEQLEMSHLPSNQSGQYGILNKSLQQSIEYISENSSLSLQTNSQQRNQGEPTQRSISKNLPNFLQSTIHKKNQFTKQKNYYDSNQSIKMQKIDLFGRKEKQEKDEYEEFRQDDKIIESPQQEKKQTLNIFEAFFGKPANSTHKKQQISAQSANKTQNSVLSYPSFSGIDPSLTNQNSQSQLPLQSKIKPELIEQAQKRINSSHSQNKLNNILQQIMQMQKQQNQSPVRRKRNLLKKQKEKLEEERKRSQRKIMKMAYLSENTFEQLSTGNICMDSMNTIISSQRQKDHDDDDNALNALTNILNQMMKKKNHNMSDMKEKIKNQKNLRLKDYLRLASLSMKNRSQKYRSLSVKQQKITRIHNSKLNVPQVNISSPQRNVIDRSESINLLKKAIYTKFKNTMKTTKILLATLKSAGQQSLFEDELKQGQNLYNQKSNKSDPLHLVQDSYQDLVFMCNIHRVFDDGLFVSVKALKQLLQDFRKQRKQKAIDQQFLKNIINTLIGIKNEKNQKHQKQQENSKTEQLPQQGQNTGYNFVKSLVNFLNAPEGQNIKKGFKSQDQIRQQFEELQTK